MELLLAVLSLLGTAVFAASGALIAAEKRFDVVGAVFLSVAAGLGGSTLVDLLIRAPILRWAEQPELLWTALFAGVLVFEVVRIGHPPAKTLAWADAIGLAIFTATLMERLFQLHLDPAVTIFLAALGASGGGIIRDVLANREPLVFSGEIYVTAAVLGALVYLSLQAGGIDGAWPLIGAIAVTFLVRAAGLAFGLRLLQGSIPPAGGV